MKTIGVIPSRFNSSRYPGKPLVDIFGKPMIYWVAKRVSTSTLLDEYIVATDDKRIYDVCDNFNIPVMMTSVEHVNGTERVSEVAERTDGDFYINIQGDEPLIEPENIDKIIQVIKNDSIDYVQAGVEISNLTDLVDNAVVKIAVGENGNILFFSRSPIPYPRTITEYKAYKCLGLYGFKKEFLIKFVNFGESPLEKIEGIEQLRVLENGFSVQLAVMDHDSISVDTPSDLKRIIAEYKESFS